MQSQSKSPYTALEIANAFVELIGDEKDKYGIKLSPMKLQKLLYYAFGAYYAINDIPLFSEKILGWEHGPVVEEVYNEYKSDKYINEELPDFKEPQRQYTLHTIANTTPIDKDTLQILKDVYDMFGYPFTYWQLRNLTHKETPWINATHDGDDVHGNIIDIEEIRKYFLENYITEYEEETA